MESELLPDKEKNVPPVPIKTYQWEDVRRAREAGAYPWTHLLKEPLEGEITAEDILRESTPRRSISREVSRSTMSREFSRSRTRSPIDRDVQQILDLDSSPGSSRKHGESGEDEGVQIPHFSKDSEGDNIKEAVKAYIVSPPETPSGPHLVTPIEIPKNISPKGILKRRTPEQQYVVGITETREKTKCCHPLVNKIKHLADKTLHKLDRSENEKSPTAKRKKNEDGQEIRQLKCSPGAVRRQKFSAIKLGDSDEMSKTMSVDTPPPRKKKEHIYEDIEEKSQEAEKSLHFASEVETRDFEAADEENKSNSNKENESLAERKSNASQDPSLVIDNNTSLKPEEHVMEILHKKDTINKEAIFLDEEMDPEEPNIEEVFQNQFEDTKERNESPNVTITEILDDDVEPTETHTPTIPIEISPSPSPLEMKRKKEVEIPSNEWSKPSSDHEYEIIEKPSQNIVYNIPSAKDRIEMVKTDDELSSTTSLERKYLHSTSDDDDQLEDKENLGEDKHESLASAEALQRDIEDRYFANTPSTVSRTECEISTSQVDSSALENLPLNRANRTKNPESFDNKIQQRFKEGTGKIKTQAGKLKTKIQNIKTPQFSMPERPKFNRPTFKMPERPKISLPERPKFSLPDKRKFSLPDRPKFKKINISEKLSLGDRKKFTLPERPKFTVPDMPKFRMPERPKLNFPSLGKGKKEYKIETVKTTTTGSTGDIKNIASVEFETKTYPRLFGRKKKAAMQKTSSSPTLNREDTPPATFTFSRVKKVKTETEPYIPDSPEEPREYGNEMEAPKRFETTYDFDNVDAEYMNGTDPSQFSDNRNAASTTDISPNQEYTHVINEIDNDEFFVRPRGISRENIQVREYLSDEIRQAFKIPKNVLASMGSDPRISDGIMYMNEPDADPELEMDENEMGRYSNEDVNERDDGYYTFPPVRPSRAKRKKKPDPSETIHYIDDNLNTTMQFSEIDLGLSSEKMHNQPSEILDSHRQMEFSHPTDLHSIHEYANDEVFEYPDEGLQSQTLPMPPKRKKRGSKKDYKHSSLLEMPTSERWTESCEPTQDIIVYRTEHEYPAPTADFTMTSEPSPLPPRRNRSRSSRGTSLCDDDRTSRGADSLTLDTTNAHIADETPHTRQESPGYATVDKNPAKPTRRSHSKTPPPPRRKSNSSERKYYTVGPTKAIPDRPPRKKSSTSLMTLDSYSKRSVSQDLTQYVEIDEPPLEEVHKHLTAGEILSKMKDRPLPPPPRPPRGARKDKKKKPVESSETESKTESEVRSDQTVQKVRSVTEHTRPGVEEIEVSTQTDPLPDDVDFELGIEENLCMSMSSSLRDIVDDELSKHRKTESPRYSRPTSRSEKSFKLSDPKISELSKPNVGRTSPTVILVERRVSSPTRINERDEMLTEASLTVQHIDIEESRIPEVPPLPKPREIKTSKISSPPPEEQALQRVTDTTSRDVQLDNLITQRLQVRDLDVGRLNVSELQANRVLVSEIEGMTLQVAELDSKSGHISVSGIEFSQTIIDEIVKKFAEITTNRANEENQRPDSREEHTQTEERKSEENKTKMSSGAEGTSKKAPEPPPRSEDRSDAAPIPPPRPAGYEDAPHRPPGYEDIPQRPPPPDLTPLLYSYLQDISLPPSSFYGARSLRERPFTEFHESQHHSPPTTSRRPKRKPVAHQSESSSEDKPRPSPSPRRMPRSHEPSVAEAGANFLRVCHHSVSRLIRNMFNSLLSYISGAEDKKDVQMALVIFLVLIAGLIMFGLSDSRTVHHHHWEFFNPPDTKPT